MTAVKKTKLIDLMLKKGLAPNKKEAQAFILEGRVFSSGIMVDKPGTLVDPGGDIKVAPRPQYVSRGGLKLESAFEDFHLCADGLNAIDVGSSAGGFTDFLLKHGAKKVVAIDVGYGLLSWKLRNLDQVIVFERTNIRYLDTGRLPFLSDLTVADLSFISLKTVFEKLLQITGSGGIILVLFKPQFELKKEKVQAKGIIRDKFLHMEALLDFISYLNRHTVIIKGLTFSKTRGAKGNIEYWIYIEKNSKENNFKYDKMVKNAVERSHKYFGQNGE